MSHTPQELLTLADKFEKICKNANETHEGFMKWLEKAYGYDHEQYSKLDSGAKKHLHEMYEHEGKETKKEAANKKLDPKAKVRNRGTVCVPAEQAKDHKDHFPINDEGQARSALSRVEGLTSAPWYKGSLEGLRALVKRKVHSKFPGIGKDKKKKSSALEVSETLLNKYANQPFPSELEYYTLDEVAETLPVSKETYRALWTLMPSDKENPPYEGEYPPEPDHSSRKARSLKKFWHKLTPEQQKDVAGAKARDEAEMAKYRTPQPVEEPENVLTENPFDDDRHNAHSLENLLNKYAQTPAPLSSL